MRLSLFGWLGSALLASTLLSLSLGAVDLTLPQVWQALTQGGNDDFIINQYRLPRALLAILVGAGLGLSGILVQGVIRNPLASPDLMGISAGAGLAATALILFLPAAGYWLPLAAVAGGMGAALLIYALARQYQPAPARLALTGIAVSAFLSSLIDFLLIIHPVELNNALIWLTGSLWGRSWEQIPLLGVGLALLIPLALRLAWRLDIYALGEQSAVALGARPKALQIQALLLAVVLASLSVCVAGTISFVGLLAPHFARLLCGGHHRLLIPVSALSGALLVSAADLIARTLQPPLELPVGVVTAIIGAPYFIFLLLRYKGW
ncbi:iron chelate uptake ABC transporter family permease subunit [Marinobacterium sp. D7]|uniref:FecCD family ABC transporter permease n=1 Tax=Marinobacterium ramblicola TaxID=2849041 RepID=UPI001C2D0856|nr:iron chelate uptake ABC transporter family permease subunit [Marinobacterium ramblicola]MBV1789629.1 iron chelate uptake ABC transporter family permease subunit [Marinobacterium ramblicola]